MTTCLERPKRGGGNEASLDDGKTWRKLLPILFTSDNAQKCFDGTKTQTRRVLNPQPNERDGKLTFDFDTYAFIRASSGLEHHSGERWWPRYRVGDILWCQQPWRTDVLLNNVKPTNLPTNAPIWMEDAMDVYSMMRPGKLRPARFMPLRFSRPARYEVVAVKCERVNAISEADAKAEGVEPAVGGYFSGGKGLLSFNSAKKAFNSLWNSINTEPGTRFDDSPWVFAYTLRRIK